jgi:hypothetical protein
MDGKFKRDSIAASVPPGPKEILSTKNGEITCPIAVRRARPGSWKAGVAPIFKGNIVKSQTHPSDAFGRVS